MKYKVKSGEMKLVIEAVSEFAAVVIALNQHTMDKGGSLGQLTEVKCKGEEPTYLSTMSILDKMGILETDKID